MVKIYYEGDTDLFYNHQTRLVLKLSNWLNTHHQIIFSELPKSELIWTTTEKLNQKLLDTGLPIILDDRHQGPELFQGIREWLHNPQIIKILKQTKLKNIEEYNADLVNYSHHQHRISQAFKIPGESGGKFYPPLQLDLAYKITTSWNYIGWGDFITETRYEWHDHPKLSAQYKYNTALSDKYIDVNFLANTNFESSLISTHRKAAYENLCNIGNIRKITTNDKIKWEKYYNILCHSKITIVPWGWEPITVRDIEAALAGSIIVKPDTSWLETWPDIEYVKCQADYSDLNDIITDILSNINNYTDMCARNIKNITEAAETIGYRMANIITQ